MHRVRLFQILTIVLAVAGVVAIFVVPPDPYGPYVVGGLAGSAIVALLNARKARDAAT